MQSIFGNHSSEKQKNNKPAKIKSQLPVCHCVLLIITLIFQAFILFLFIHSTPPQPAAGPEYFQASSFTTEQCKSGWVYVYNLPEMFNKEFLENCQDIDPWSSLCNAVSNGGFGPPATALNGVVPENLTGAWYWTDMYSAEVVYHTRILGYDCRTEDPKLATAFYVPFYVGLAVGKYLWFNHPANVRDYYANEILKWLEGQESWKRFNGSDHFIMLGRLTWDFRRCIYNKKCDDEWGTSFLNMPAMKNVLRLSVEKSPWDDMEISVPYPTGFHPRSDSDLIQWQRFIRSRNRSSLFTFVGATRKKIKNDFRGLLMTYCKNETGVCRDVDCAVTRCYDGAPAILDAFLDSDFCLQPKGDGFTRRSFFDCMLAGSIPVFFWKGSFSGQYQWHLPIVSSTISVFIDHTDVRNDTSIIKKVLEKYSREEVERKRERIIEILPQFVYTRSGKDLEKNRKDAFDVGMERVLRRFKRQKDEYLSRNIHQ